MRLYVHVHSAYVIFRSTDIHRRVPPIPPYLAMVLLTAISSCVITDLSARLLLSPVKLAFPVVGPRS